MVWAANWPAEPKAIVVPEDMAPCCADEKEIE
jgi:hypothetical protein